VGMPAAATREVHGMMVLVEHGTTPLGGRLDRFTRLPAEEREAFLGGLEARGGLWAQAYRGLRDLCVLGYYQQAATWPALGYEGPAVPAAAQARPAWPAYEALRAPPGARPRALRETT